MKSFVTYIHYYFSWSCRSYCAFRDTVWRHVVGLLSPPLSESLPSASTWLGGLSCLGLLLPLISLSGLLSPSNLWDGYS